MSLQMKDKGKFKNLQIIAGYIAVENKNPALILRPAKNLSLTFHEG
jgi:hypothetical protein